MADGTSIEWTDATWNPVTGCSVVSPGCTNCYAMKLAGTRLRHTPSRQGLTIDTKAGPVWNGEVRLNEQWLDQPLRWKRPRRIFVCAHGDLFAEKVRDEWIDRVFAVMALAPQHTFQVLTKRAKRMREYATLIDNEPVRDTVRRIVAAWPGNAPIPAAITFPLPNVWLGVSAEDQARADERVPDLLATPAAIRFISAEPLLGPIDFHEYLLGFAAGHPASCICGHGHGFDRCPNYGKVAPRCHKCGCQQFHKAPGSDGLHWVIVGGESGAAARPMHPAWARSIRDQCAGAGVAFFFKQWGGWKIHHAHAGGDLGGDIRADRVRFVQPNREPDGHFRKGDLMMERVGKKVAGRLLDGIEHNAFPEVTA
jgi:protein gp37